jgi:hypothetical protein
LSSCPSWAIDVAGASVPVASAIATGNESRTAITAGLAAPVIGAWPRVACGETHPSARTATAAMMNDQVITAKIIRPP